MPIFRIENPDTNHILGDYESDSETEALDAFAREAGYPSYVILNTEIPGKLIVTELAKSTNNEDNMSYIYAVNFDDFEAGQFTATRYPAGCAVGGDWVCEATGDQDALDQMRLAAEHEWCAPDSRHYLGFEVDFVNAQVNGDHHHQVESTSAIRCFSGCVAPHDCHPAAHGSMAGTERCACGATREYAINGTHIEVGRWTRS